MHQTHHQVLKRKVKKTDAARTCGESRGRNRGDKIQASLRDVAGSVLDHRNEVSQ